MEYGGALAVIIGQFLWAKQRHWQTMKSLTLPGRQGWGKRVSTVSLNAVLKASRAIESKQNEHCPKDQKIKHRFKVTMKIRESTSFPSKALSSPKLSNLVSFQMHSNLEKKQEEKKLRNWLFLWKCDYYPKWLSYQTGLAWVKSRLSTGHSSHRLVGGDLREKAVYIIKKTTKSVFSPHFRVIDSV